MKIAMGGVLGAVALSVATSIFDAVLQPADWRDGQYVFVYFATIPLGVVLGVITSLSIRERRRGEQKAAAQIALAGGVSGIVLSLVTGLQVAFVLSLVMLFCGLATYYRRTT